VEGLTGGVGMSVTRRGGLEEGTEVGFSKAPPGNAIAAAAAVGFGPKRWWPSGCTVKMEILY